MKLLTLIRGLPGSGKTTLAQSLGVYYEADQYFYIKGEYVFDPAKLYYAHMDCLARTEAAMKREERRVIVSNTFVRVKEAVPYVKLAQQYSYALQIITCQSSFSSTHDVSESTLDRMRRRWQDYQLRELYNAASGGD